MIKDVDMKPVEETMNLTENSKTQMIEAVFEIPSLAADPWCASVWAEITEPESNIVTVPAFFDGGNIWKIRFTPKKSGLYKLGDIKVGDNPNQSLNVSANVSGPTSFEVKDQQGAGFIRRSSNWSQQFTFDDELPYFPIGHNLAWLEWNEYEPRFAEMSEAGLNWSRVWMCHWAHLNLDWRVGKQLEPGTIDLEVARAWDRIIAAAEENGIYLQVVLQHHGQYSTFANANWHENPWNVANGGWLNEPEDFFTDAKANEITRRKYRYIVARWGYSPAVMAWELFNEVQFTNAYVNQDALDLWRTWQENDKQITPELLLKAEDVLARISQVNNEAASMSLSLADLPAILNDVNNGRFPYIKAVLNEETVTNWHNEMASWIRSIDPWHHLVTTSSVPVESAVWDSMDFIQFHSYQPEMINAVSDFGIPLSSLTKPAFWGEVGDHEIEDPAKADGRYMRTMLWASLMSGAAGSAQIWAWHRINELEFYNEYKVITHFIEIAEIGSKNYTPFQPVVNADPPVKLSALGMRSDNSIVSWIYQDESIHLDSSPEVRGHLLLPDFKPGKYNVAWINTKNGIEESKEVLTMSSDGILEVVTPAFEGDIACTVKLVEVQ